MRSAVLVILAVFDISGAAPARADHAPVIAVPGRPGVPVIINGHDASYGIVEGDWGLFRTGHWPTVILGPPALHGPPGGGYFPSSGRQPRTGRYEIEPPANRLLPPPAETYRREWSIYPKPAPVTEYPPFDPPPVIVAPNFHPRGSGDPHEPKPKDP